MARFDDGESMDDVGAASSSSSVGAGKALLLEAVMAVCAGLAAVVFDGCFPLSIALRKAL